MKIRLLDSALETFIHSLEATTIAKVLRAIDLLEEFSHTLGMPHSRKIKNNLFELRIRGKQEVRIFYTFHNQEIILLYGFLKKISRIPPREIRIAIRKADTLAG